MGTNLDKTYQLFRNIKWYLRKFIIIWFYLFDVKNHQDYKLMAILLKYLFTLKSNRKDIIVNAHFGRFLLRNGTMDFKMANKAYERKVFNVFKTKCEKADLILDIGANAGIYSLIAAGLGKRVIAFEPVQDNYQALFSNIKLNNFEGKIKVFKFGLGSKDETVLFNFNKFNTGMARKSKIHLKSETRKVEIKKFDNLIIPELKSAKNILIKIDTEGMELEILMGLKALLESEKELSLLLESKHSSRKSIKNILDSISQFKYSKIDSFNILAEKLH